MGIELYVFYSSHPVPQLHSFSVIPLSIFPSPALSLSLFFPAMQFHYLSHLAVSASPSALVFSPYSEILRNAEDSALAFSPSLPLVQLTHISFLFISSPCSVFFLSQPCNISGKKSLYMPKTKKKKNTLTLEHLRERKFALPYF